MDDRNETLRGLCDRLGASPRTWPKDTHDLNRDICLAQNLLHKEPPRSGATPEQLLAFTRLTSCFRWHLPAWVHNALADAVYEFSSGPCPSFDSALEKTTGKPFSRFTERKQRVRNGYAYTVCCDVASLLAGYSLSERAACCLVWAFYVTWQCNDGVMSEVKARIPSPESLRANVWNKADKKYFLETCLPANLDGLRDFEHLYRDSLGFLEELYRSPKLTDCPPDWRDSRAEALNTLSRLKAENPPE